MHKGLEVEYRPTRFADVETIKQLSGQPLVPILVDGATVVHDSWRIALYLEDRFPEWPTLFGDDAARAGARCINLWSDTLLVTLRRLIYADFIWCLAPEDRAYFRASREKELGQTLEAACADRRNGRRGLTPCVGPWSGCSPSKIFSAGLTRAIATILCSRSFSGHGWAAPTISSSQERRWTDGAR